MSMMAPRYEAAIDFAAIFIDYRLQEIGRGRLNMYREEMS
jgi:hypothetical protein